MYVSQRNYICSSFESATVAWVFCLGSVNPKLFSNFPHKNWKITFQYHKKNWFYSITKKRTNFTIIVGDFNDRSTTWWLTSYHRFEKVINEPAQFLPKSASCIDLIFADTPNLIVGSGVFPSLHVTFHHHQYIQSLTLM